MWSFYQRVELNTCQEDGIYRAKVASKFRVAIGFRRVMFCTQSAVIFGSKIGFKFWPANKLREFLACGAREFGAWPFAAVWCAGVYRRDVGAYTAVFFA